MSNLRDYILLEYGGIADGTVLSGQLCPSCRGGNKGETSLSVGNQNGVLWWRCHRNKCGFRGLHGAPLRNRTGAVQHPPGRWNYEREPLSKEWLNYLSKRFRIPNEILAKEWEWTDKYGGRVVLPIKSERGHLTGYTLRSYSEDETKKALIHRVMEDVGHAWYQGSPYPSHVVLLEDQPSALRLSQAMGINTIALLGTHIPQTLMETIKHRYTHKCTPVVALDQDATAEAAKHVLKMRAVLPDTKLLPLEKDVKDMSEEEFVQTIKRIKHL